MRGNKTFKIPGLAKFGSIIENMSDLRQRANNINSELRQMKTLRDAKREELNEVLFEIEQKELKEAK